eukprot:IDg22634t1
MSSSNSVSVHIDNLTSAENMEKEISLNSFRVVNKLLNVAKTGDSTAKRYAYAFLSAGLTWKELNHMLENKGMEKVGDEYFTSRRNDFGAIEAGRSLLIRRR